MFFLKSFPVPPLGTINNDTATNCKSAVHLPPTPSFVWWVPLRLTGTGSFCRHSFSQALAALRDNISMTPSQWYQLSTVPVFHPNYYTEADFTNIYVITFSIKPTLNVLVSLWYSPISLL